MTYDNHGVLDPSEALLLRAWADRIGWRGIEQRSGVRPETCRRVSALLPTSLDVLASIRALLASDLPPVAEVTCQSCGAVIPEAGRLRRTCDPCKLAVRRERHQRRLGVRRDTRRQQRAAARAKAPPLPAEPLPPPPPCPTCGAPCVRDGQLLYCRRRCPAALVLTTRAKRNP